MDLSVRTIPEHDLKAVEESMAVQRQIEAERAVAGDHPESAERVPA